MILRIVDGSQPEDWRPNRGDMPCPVHTNARVPHSLDGCRWAKPEPTLDDYAEAFRIMRAGLSYDQTRQTCPYAVGAGTCDIGCWEEPSCTVDTPLNGWMWRGLDGRFGIEPSREVMFAVGEIRQAAKDARRAHPVGSDLL